MPLQIRRGTEAERQLLNVPPVEGELIWITDDFKLYIGDGTTLAKNLAPVTGYADANAVNAVGNAFATGTHNNINFTYAAGSISASVDLTDYQGEINATAIRSSIFADDSTELVNAVDSLINLNGTVGGHIIPDDTLEFDIGSPAFRFRDLYLSGNSIDLGGAVISSPNGSIVNLPAGSTIGGVPLSSPVGDLKGSVFGDDSSVIVDGTTNTVYGTFVGNLTTSNGTIIIDSVNNTITSGLLNILKDSGGIGVVVSGVSTPGGNTTTGIDFSSSTNTVLNPGDLPDGDLGFAIVGKTWKSSISNYALSTAIVSEAASINPDPLGVFNGGKLIFYAGDGTRDVFDDDYGMSLDGNGTVSARQLVLSKYLKLPAFVDSTERDTEIPSPERGMIAILDTDDGSSAAIQYYNGVDWVTL